MVNMWSHMALSMFALFSQPHDLMFSYYGHCLRRQPPRPQRSAFTALVKLPFYSQPFLTSDLSSPQSSSIVNVASQTTPLRCCSMTSRWHWEKQSQLQQDTALLARSLAQAVWEKSNLPSTTSLGRRREFFFLPDRSCTSGQMLIFCLIV